MIEEFKSIVGYEGIYEISNLGNIRSLQRFSSAGRPIKGKALKPSIIDGYYKIVLTKNGVRKTKGVHQLVAESFLGHISNGVKMVVNHKNFIRTDNKLENLEILTNRDNCNKKHLSSSSKYTGVYWSIVGKKWVSNISIGGKSKYLGIYQNEYDAHLAYQKALKELTIK